MPYARYLSVANVRAEGSPFSDATAYPDAWVEDKIDLASEQIEGFTGNWFSALARTIKLDGNGGNLLPLPFPIVYITSITLIYAARYGADPTYSVDTDEVIIYNRHLTQGLVSPDDRKAPGISIEAFLAYPKEDLNIWPAGDQNIKIVGKFGWTSLAHDDTIGETVEGNQIPSSEGVTPAQIKRACMLLVRRAWPKVGDFHGMMGVSKPISDITQMKSRDQSIYYAAPKEGNTALMVGNSTGDAEIDRILLGFRRIPVMRWA